MTDDEKKEAVVAAADPATDLTEKEAKTAMEKLSLRTLLIDAVRELRLAAQQERPLVISYRVPCPCGEEKCTTKLAIQISPYTDVIFDALRSKH